MNNTTDLVKSIIEGIQEKKGRDIAVANLTKIATAPCDYFVICTCGSPQQVDAVTDSVEEFTGKQYGEHPTLIAGRQNAVWVAMDYGTVMVHIRNLRMKVEDEPSHPTHILTVWGYGYRWEE